MKRITLGILLLFTFIPFNGFGETLIEPSDWKAGWRDLEVEMLQFINRERIRLKVSELQMDSLTREVARRHSLDMEERNYVGHETPEGWTPQDRLYDLNVYASVYGENVAKHLTITGAHQGLMTSIEHRRNILNPHFTHAGIGILQGKDGYLYITQNFIKKIERVDLDWAKREILFQLNKEEDPLLSKIAEEHSRKIFEKDEVKIPVPELEQKAKIFTWCGPYLEDFLEIEEVKRTEGSNIGIGILQGSSRKHGTGILWITLIIAE